MQTVYPDPSTSRGLKLQIYLRSIQFLLPSKLLYLFYPSILGSSFRSLPLRSSLPVGSTAHSGPKLWHLQASRSFCNLVFPIILFYINSPKFLKFLFFFYYFFLFFIFLLLLLFLLLLRGREIMSKTLAV